MKTVLVIVMALLLTACGGVPSVVLPSIDACHRVVYERNGEDVQLFAECKVQRG